MTSPDLTRANIEKIADLFPTVVTEALDADGEPTRAIDFDLLRQELSDHIVEGPQERYQLDWPGKRAAAFAANAPIAKTLRPVREESVDFDTTQNLFIEGDNLEALKLLQESYLGKVKLIYIDPPYNTGTDFVYEDDFAETSAEYLVRSGQKSDAGERLVANTEANGRFHSDWLSMMYPRLKLARSLLAPDGAIFVSIDDHERDNLKHLMDEIFGERSFVNAVIWRKKASPDARSTIGSVHDYLLCYVRDAEQPKTAVGKMALSSSRVAAYTNPDDDPRGPWASVDMTGMTGRATKDQYFEVTLPSGRVIRPPEGRSWGLVERTYQELRSDDRIWFGRGGDNVPRIKRFLAEAEGQTVPSYWDFSEVGSNEEATTEVTSLFDGLRAFDTPKPVRLMRRLLEIATRPSSNDIVLDFFAGSASMAEAVMRMNAEDGGNRRYLIVQIAEGTNPKSDAAATFNTVSAISRERLRRVGRQIAETIDITNQDVGVRMLRVDTTNMSDIDSAPDALGQEELAGMIESVKPGRTDEDLLFQVLLDWGLDLAEPIGVEDASGHRVLAVADGALVACFSDEVPLDVVRTIAEWHPLRAVFKDSGFAGDAARINAEQIFREVSPETELRTI
ncbi:MAG: site-specific DNA-methyltransferase [Microbacterium sp.]|uniref:site-specific DNA-methyltransferase n=1 Tax=Microbacterium sp. TaxID=51671 RepID=UPI002726B787|nr:site-specific DNA-methyltransferase [Microbacterium sp.]MDO8382258.1 site-specific DNA-methyltransferase [Microbacterium sp.]